MTTMPLAIDAPSGLVRRMKASHHFQAVAFYLIVVAAHLAEHAVQAIQVYALDVPRVRAGGLLGSAFPALNSSELLHWGYAVFMLAGLIMLRDATTGRARLFWTIALAIQVWHFLEHLLLVLQAWSGLHLLAKQKPTSVIQMLIPRVELHLLYNMIVTLPLLIAVGLHWFGKDNGVKEDEALPMCNCSLSFQDS